jgi:hypothetical protein
MSTRMTGYGHTVSGSAGTRLFGAKVAPDTGTVIASIGDEPEDNATD